MAVKGYFLDNETYSADDVNKAFSYITTEGVSLFSDTGSVTSDLRNTIECLTEPGVDMYNLESCKVYKSDESYMIKKGVCFLPGGAFVVVDDYEQLISAVSGEINYVYAMHDSLKNECKIYVSQSGFPDEAVALAEIDTDGNITDKRVFAAAKIAVPTTNIMASKTITLSYPMGLEKNKYTCTDEVFEVGFGGFNFAKADVDGKTFTAYIGDGEKKEFIDGSNRFAWIKKEGTTLVITTGTWSEYAKTVSEVELLLF